MGEMHDKTREAVAHIRAKAGPAPRLGLILGSGLGSLAERLSDRVSLPYSSIPHFPVSTVQGHEGNLVTGELKGVPAAVMQGRFHYYEGYFMREVTFPVRVLAGLGVDTLVVTNAAGGIGEDMTQGRFMAITDHINMMGTNPLVGMEPGVDEKDRFVDMNGAYDEALRNMAFDAAHEKGIRLVRGVLAAVTGPSYETPAEVAMLKTLGADAVCMSTVPEVIMARYLGVKVLGLSLITNRAAGLSKKGPGHDEVLEAAGKSRGGFIALIEGFVECAKAGGLL